MGWEQGKHVLVHAINKGLEINRKARDQLVFTSPVNEILMGPHVNFIPF
jgi:hypothetical protein